MLRLMISPHPKVEILVGHAEIPRSTTLDSNISVRLLPTKPDHHSQTEYYGQLFKGHVMSSSLF